MAKYILHKALSEFRNLKPSPTFLAVVGLMFPIQSHAMANSSRAYEIPEIGFRTREDLMLEYLELSERRCAKGQFSSGITGRECLIILHSRNKKCQEVLLSLMPVKISKRTDAIMWAKRHAHCLDM
jgi:hypothetical protein